MDSKAARGRMLCSEIVNLCFEVRPGRHRELKANLEEIWSSGALLWTDLRIRQHTSLCFFAGGVEFRGQVVANKVLRGLGYFIEMRFDSGCRWSEQKYRPKHFFNPLVLLANRVFETTFCMTIRPFDHPRQVAFARTAAKPRTAAKASFKAAYGR